MNIKISNLTKEYDRNRVVDIELLNIEKGALLGIIGPNGAGKSTLLRLIAGLEQPTEGEIFYEGKRLHSEIYKNMTMVFQNPICLELLYFKI